jgi:hypothetical protein
VNITPAEILAWVHLHQWAPLIAVVVGLVVRLAKSDTKLPDQLKIPAGLRPYFALFLGMAASCSVAVLGGQAWSVAVETGLMATLTAILGHETIIESWRNGVEISIPGWTVSPKHQALAPAPDPGTPGPTGPTGATGAG